MTIGNRIKDARIRKGLSQEELAKAINSTKQAIYKYENEIVTNIPMDKVEKLALILGTPPAYLMGWEEPIEELKIDNIFRIEKRSIPLLGNVACGEPIFASESFDAYVTVGTNIQADFCLRAQGDSMINARILDGDIVFVRKQEMVNDGEIAVVLIGDEATIKRVYYDREEGQLSLVPENPKYKVMRYHGEELNQIRILGKVIAGQYDIT